LLWHARWRSPKVLEHNADLHRNAGMMKTPLTIFALLCLGFWACSPANSNSGLEANHRLSKNDLLSDLLGRYDYVGTVTQTTVANFNTGGHDNLSPVDVGKNKGLPLYVGLFRDPNNAEYPWVGEVHHWSHFKLEYFHVDFEPIRGGITTGFEYETLHEFKLSIIAKGKGYRRK
jgi:hypothetical protein